MSEMENGFAVSVGDGGFVPPLCGSRAFAPVAWADAHA